MNLFFYIMLLATEPGRCQELVFFFVELLLFVHTKKNTFLHTPETNPEPKTVALLTKKLAMCETIHKCSRLALCVEQMTHGC